MLKFKQTHTHTIYVCVVLDVAWGVWGGGGELLKWNAIEISKDISTAI